MLPIYLLEDNEEQRAELASIINNKIMIDDLAMELLCCTDDPKYLLKSIKEEHQGLFFLDMEIYGDKDAGLDAAISIREHVPSANIVFITTHDELAFLTLERKVAPLDYIIKDKGKAYIKKNIIDDIQKVKDLTESEKYKKENVFVYHIASHYFSVPISDICFLATSKLKPSRITLHGLNKEAEFLGNLNDIEKQYSMFFRCDKSCLINLDLIEHFDNKKREINFKDGSSTYVSVRKSRELLKKYKLKRLEKDES